MTLEDTEVSRHQKMMEKAIGTWLTTVLKQAKKEYRLVSGMYRAAQQLESNPDNILACILPQNHLDDAAIHINHVLLEAFCYENNVHILKVDSEETLASIIEAGTLDVGEQVPLSVSRDTGCVLLQTSKGRRPSYSEQQLLELYEANGHNNDSHFVIELPVAP